MRRVWIHRIGTIGVDDGRLLTTTALVTSTGLPICAGCARREGLRTVAPRTRALLVVMVPCVFHALAAQPIVRLRPRCTRGSDSESDRYAWRGDLRKRARTDVGHSGGG
jgi:hypothetical protein